jgi:uncharacterized protein (UPF0332 family)
LTPETQKYLAKARSDLADAKKIATIGLGKLAARSAYYAAFHAAEGLIFENTGKVAKTHPGVRSEFARLTRDAPEIDRAFSTFLSEGYKLKEISDYSVDPAGEITPEEANRAIAAAERFVAGIATLLDSEPHG